jgi:protocatechuate 3,4-dioxygenase beta subunit
MKAKIIFAGIFAILLVACTAPQDTPAPMPTSRGEATTVPESPANLPGATSEEAKPKIPVTASEPPARQPTGAEIEPIEVTYFTPAQGEGPYYTVNKPADRDNDLTIVSSQSGRPAGQVLEFSGRVYDATGLPIEGAVIEIWQTDNSGVYLHPNDPATGERDPNFQFYGEATTGVDGSYWFRTILPGKYEPRPIHIHFKVLVEGQVLLTSQFYFGGDPGLESDSLFLGAGGESEHLIVRLSNGTDADGNAILVGERDIILDF